MSDEPDVDPMTADEVAEMPEGAPVTVTWSGGNGPHDYVIAVDHYGSRFVWDGETDRLRFYNPLRFIGRARYHTRVWRRES